MTSTNHKLSDIEGHWSPSLVVFICHFSLIFCVMTNDK